MLLTGCGGGGGGNSESPGPIAAPSGLSYPSPPDFEAFRQITPLTPSVNGTVTSYSVSPTLPTGLTLDSTTGILSGTPTVAAATAVYTVTAANSSGSTTTGISVTVTGVAPPSISYPSRSYSLAIGRPIESISPQRTGGNPLSWSISQPLPAGLSFDSTTGRITGTPTATAAAAVYEITASNLAGSGTFALTIDVSARVILELGHVAEIISIQREGNRILSVDETGHWVLWNQTDAEIVAQGESSCGRYCDTKTVKLAGSTVLSKFDTQLQVTDTTDGRVLATIDSGDSWATLASDGSYIAAGTTAHVRVWSRSGDLLLTRPGDYRYARPFAAPTELRIGAGPAGNDRVEKISVSTGASTTVPHAGAFHSWFSDGSRFFSNVSNTVWVYDNADGHQLDLRALASTEQLTGQGDWFWTADNSSPYRVEIYEVGASATPTASYSFPYNYEAVASADTIGILNSGTGQISIIDLSGATPVKVDHATSLDRPRAYGAISSTQWLTGSQYGVLAREDSMPGTPAFFGWGAVRSLAASIQRIVVATASGRIVYFDAATHEQEGVIDFAADDVQLSEDGSVLGAQGDGLRFYSLPSENVLLSRPESASFTLATSGAVFSMTPSTAQPTQVIRMSDEAVLWTRTSPSSAPPRLSPSGSSLAEWNGDTQANSGTDVYVDLGSQANGTLHTALSGRAVDWFDDNRLLVSQSIITTAPTPQYVGTIIYDLSSGQQSARLPFPVMSRFQPMTSERIYSPSGNLIASMSDGSTLWQGPYPISSHGGVTPTHVIFVWDATVRAAPY
jgi:hypothetical protein